MVDFEHQVGKTRQFHVGIARLMELTNCLYKFSDKHPEDRDLSKLVFSYLTRGLYPYCPHLASEVWTLTYQGDVNQATADY
jgi:leucyl-tRNA synthetase